MVETMGGMGIWSQLKSVHFVHEWSPWYRVDSYIENEILDLTGPRSWVEMESEVYQRVRAYSPEHRYWSVVNGEFSDAEEEFWNGLPSPDVLRRSRTAGTAVLHRSRCCSNTPTMMAYATKLKKPQYAADMRVMLQPAYLQESWSRLSFIGDWGDREFARGLRLWPKMLAYLRALRGAGVMLRLGSDFPNPYVLAGTGLHQEMAIFVETGFSPSEVLRLATYGAACTLRLDHQIGSVEAGKRADLVLLDADPRESISNAAQIRWVMQEGRLLDPIGRGWIEAG